MTLVQSRPQWTNGNRPKIIEPMVPRIPKYLCCRRPGHCSLPRRLFPFNFDLYIDSETSEWGRHGQAHRIIFLTQKYRATASAAPVLVGSMDKSGGLGPIANRMRESSNRDHRYTRDRGHKSKFMPKLSRKTWATGARQLVVQRRGNNIMDSGT
jgi:hypothetical protein